MRIAFDPEKNLKNIQERGLSFEDVDLLDWNHAVIEEDDRNDYGEERFVALLMFENRLHVVCFKPIKDGIRVISFRKANKREVRHYEQKTTY